MDIELRNCDCIEIMDKMIASGFTVDCIVTDPPYKLDNHGGGKTDLAQRKLVKDLHIDFMSKSFDYESVFSRMLKIQKKPNMLIFCSNKQISSIMSFFEQKKLSTTLLVWNKTNPSPLCNSKHVSDLEFIVYVRGKGVTFNNDTPFSFKRKLYTSQVVGKKDRFHAAQKPVELLEQYIKLHTNENDIVFDAFMGSGSTGVACVNTNRRFIGVELDSKYFEIAKERIELCK